MRLTQWVLNRAEAVAADRRELLERHAAEDARARTCQCRRWLPLRMYLSRWMCGLCGRVREE